MFFDELRSEFKKLFSSRTFHLTLIAIVLFVILVNRLFILQIVNGSSYSTDFTAKTEISYSVPGAKGNIYDRNGVLLAYNELAYTVKICDSGKYESTAIKNKTLNDIIYNTVKIIEENGDTVQLDFPISVSEYGHYVFTVSESSKLKFFRDIFGKTSVSLLSEEEKAYSASETIEYLSKNYGVSEEYAKDDVIKIIYFRNLMKNNSYQRYIEFSVATEVSDKTVAAILENSEMLTGVSIKEDYVRKYVDGKYFSHIIGYTGRVSQEELVELLEQDSQYEANDIVGKSGIESAMELYLTGDKGEKKVYVDNVGRITEVISETDPTRGNDVYLTIDAKLTKQIYDQIEKSLSTILLSKIVNGGEESRYTYTNTGSISDIFIPIYDVYFALIDNNVISNKDITKGETDIQIGVFKKFNTRQTKVLGDIFNDLNDKNTPMNKLSEEMFAYEYYIYQYLLNNSIITSSDIDTDDEVYKAWKNDEISLREFLTHALAENWIDISSLVDEDYQSLYEAYNSLIKYLMEELPKDEGFNKKIYKYLIKNGTISGRELCIILYEQGVLEYNETECNRLRNHTLGAYTFITDKIRNLEITPAQLALKPCSGSAIITSTKTGEILAMVSYPSYDNNMFSGSVDATYYNQLLNDKSLPLINRSTSSLTAPGSTYKIVSTVAGVCEGVLGYNEHISCKGIYEEVTPSPKCWVYPGRHGSLEISGALDNSCNYFYYEVGYRLSIDSNGKFSNELGTSRLQKYAELLGLASKTGIEIYESTPRASTINSVASAIGQGNNNYSPLNLARYVTTIATKGTCYNFTLISKVVDEKGDIVMSYTPDVYNECEFVSDELWNKIHHGMKEVLSTNGYYRDLGFSVAGKTGTAQENLKEPNHALIITFGPYDDCEITVTTVIQNGYSSSNAAMLSSEIYKIYYDLEINENNQISGGNAVTD